MQDLDATLIHDAANIGKVMGLPGTVVDQLRAVEAFKTTQGWGMFRRPGMLIREETVQIADAMKAAQVQKNTAVTIIDGERGTGKSMMLLQAMTTAFLKSWIVVNIPEGKSPILRIQNMPLTREQPKI
jgi:small subunit ribosomal protein S29